MALFVKNLPKDANLSGMKLKTKTGVVGYYLSSTDGIVHFNTRPDGVLDNNRTYPQILAKPDIIMSWEVIQEERIIPNCHMLTDLKHIVNE